MTIKNTTAAIRLPPAAKRILNDLESFEIKLYEEAIIAKKCGDNAYLTTIIYLRHEFKKVVARVEKNLRRKG